MEKGDKNQNKKFNKVSQGWLSQSKTGVEIGASLSQKRECEKGMSGIFLALPLGSFLSIGN